MRCFPQFIKSLPDVVKKNPNVIVEIAGEDTISYGGKTPSQGSWKKWAIDYLEKNNISKRVIWKGYLKGEDYINWLSSSWCHVYLTHPFVASWSLVEALHIGTPIVASNIKAVREFTINAERVVLVDHRQQKSLTDGINIALKRFNKNSSPKNQGFVDSKWSARTCAMRWRRVLCPELPTTA